MPEDITYRQMEPGEEIEVCNLVARSFNEFIAPDFSDEGVDEFYKYANHRSLFKRSESNCVVLVAEEGKRFAGMIELRDHTHISMLFIDKAYHRRGIAKQLFIEVIEQSKASIIFPARLTVYSSPYAVPYYENIGFKQTGNKKIIHGIVHYPMALMLNDVREIGR